MWWFAVAGAVPVAGVIVAIVIVAIGVNAYLDRIDGFERIPVPGTSEITFDSTGGYTVYHEHERLDDTYSFVDDPTVTITDPSGEEVDLDPYDTTVTYNEGGDDGEAMWSFDVDEQGTYTVRTDGDAESTVAIGRGIGSGLVASIGGAIVVGVLSVIAGIVIAIVVGVRRSQNRSRLRPPWPPGPPGWGYPPPGGYGPGPGGPYPGGYGGGAGQPYPGAYGPGAGQAFSGGDAAGAGSAYPGAYGQSSGGSPPSQPAAGYPGGASDGSSQVPSASGPERQPEPAPGSEPGPSPQAAPSPESAPSSGSNPPSDGPA